MLRQKSKHIQNIRPVSPPHMNIISKTTPRFQHSTSINTYCGVFNKLTYLVHSSLLAIQLNIDTDILPPGPHTWLHLDRARVHSNQCQSHTWCLHSPLGRYRYNLLYQISRNRWLHLSRGNLDMQVIL